MIAPRNLFARDGSASGVTARAEMERDEYQQGVREMRYFIAFIVGVVLTIGGAWLYDNMSGATNPLVNWTTAKDIVVGAVNKGREQIGRLLPGQ
jgi:hypothetical protein